MSGNPAARRRRWYFAAAVLALICGIYGVASMASNPQPTVLTWEGAAGRTPQRFILVRLDQVSKEGGGLFGLHRSPSLAQSLPDATILEGRQIAGAAPGAEVSVRMPGADVPAVGKGDRVALGVVEGNICICALAPPAGLGDDQVAQWASQQACGDPG